MVSHEELLEVMIYYSVIFSTQGPSPVEFVKAAPQHLQSPFVQFPSAFRKLAVSSDILK